MNEFVYKRLLLTSFWALFQKSLWRGCCSDCWPYSSTVPELEFGTQACWLPQYCCCDSWYWVGGTKPLKQVYIVSFKCLLIIHCGNLSYIIKKRLPFLFNMSKNYQGQDSFLWNIPCAFLPTRNMFTLWLLVQEIYFKVILTITKTTHDQYTINI